MPLQRLQQETTSTEFNEWCVYLQEDLKVVQRQEYYLARIAAMIYSAVTKKPAPLKDFVFDFTPKAAPTEDDLMEEEKRQQHIQESKAAWTAIVHSKPQKPPPQPPKKPPTKKGK